MATNPDREKTEKNNYSFTQDNSLQNCFESQKTSHTLMGMYCHLVALFTITFDLSGQSGQSDRNVFMNIKKPCFDK